MYHLHHPKDWDDRAWVMSDSIRYLREDATFVPEVGSPTVRRRELGALLRKLRTGKGLTVEQAAEQLMISMSKLSRMENGYGAASARDVRDLCTLYGITDETERQRLMTLAREGKQQAWWQPYDLDFETYVGLEQAAVGLCYHQCTIVPGLLQTRAYARAMLEATIPELTADRINALLEVKLTRQHVLTRDDPLELWAVLDEAVLHRAVGGREVMAEQLNRLGELSGHDNIKIQVIPYAAGAHPAMDSTFNILEFTGAVPRVIYVEGLVGYNYLDRPADLDRYQQVFDRLIELALTPEESVAMIARISQDHASR
jgi:transcriptional regulator with XRE-family HTH domain